MGERSRYTKSEDGRLEDGKMGGWVEVKYMVRERWRQQNCRGKERCKGDIRAD